MTEALCLRGPWLEARFSTSRTTESNRQREYTSYTEAGELVDVDKQGKTLQLSTARAVVAPKQETLMSQTGRTAHYLNLRYYCICFLIYVLFFEGHAAIRSQYSER